MKIREFHDFITPDGKVYPLHTASRHGRWVMQSQGWGTPPIEYITQRGTFQHGETVKDFFLQPRVIQLLIEQSFCDRDAQWQGRFDLLNAIRPNRQLTPVSAVPGTLRRILPDGSARDIKVFIQEGPTFDPDLGDGYREHSFKEVLRFIAHDPVIFDPVLQVYTEDFSTLTHTLDLQINDLSDEIWIYYNGANWTTDGGTSFNLFVGDAPAPYHKMGGGLKFNDVTVPPGATITVMYISGNSYLIDDNTDTVRSRITGNKEVNPDSFSTVANYQSRRGTVVGGADDLKITTAQVDWDSIVHFVHDTWYNSPDISTIGNELIAQPGWISGQSMVLFWDDHDDRSDSGINRAIKKLLGNGTLAPKLHIVYTTAGILTIPYPGTWLTYPKIFITGPLNDAVITNLDTGEKLALDYHIPTGRTITIDLAYGVKTVVDDLGTNLIGVLTSDSDLATFHIAPDPEVPGGLNHISVSGTAESVGVTSVRVEFYNRYFGI